MEQKQIFAIAIIKIGFIKRLMILTFVIGSQKKCKSPYSHMQTVIN